VYPRTFYTDLNGLRVIVVVGGTRSYTGGADTVGFIPHWRKGNYDAVWGLAG
jgi:hypothetical protein